MNRRFQLVLCLLLTGILCQAQEAKVSWETLVRGEGEQTVKMGDTIDITYRLTLSTGEPIDATAEGKTFEMQVGSENVIPGLSQGVVGMSQGEVRKLTVPPALGYGAITQGPIPGYSTLLFEVKLVSFVQKSSTESLMDPGHENETPEEHASHSGHENESPDEHAGHDHAHSGSDSEAPPQLAQMMTRDFFASPWYDSDGPKKIWRSNLWLTLWTIFVVLLGWVANRGVKQEKIS